MNILFIFPIQLFVMSIIIRQCKWEFIYNTYNTKRISLILSLISSLIMFFLAVFIYGILSKHGLLLAFLSVIIAIFSFFFLIMSKYSTNKYFSFECIDGQYETYGESRFDKDLCIQMKNENNEPVYIYLGVKRPVTDNFTLYCKAIPDQFSQNRYKSIFFTYKPNIMAKIEWTIFSICAFLSPCSFFLSTTSNILNYFYMFIVLYIFCVVIRNLLCSIQFSKLKYRIYYYLFLIIELIDILGCLLFLIYSLGRMY